MYSKSKKQGGYGSNSSANSTNPNGTNANPTNSLLSKPPLHLSDDDLRVSCERLSGKSIKCLTQPTLAGRMAYCVKHPHIVTVLGDIIVKDMVSGLDHVMVMSDKPEKNSVLSWGRNDSGQTGHGNLKHDSIPLPLEQLQSKKIRDFGCGAAHSVVVTENGEVFTWGAGNMGQLGHGKKMKESIPTAVAGLRRCHVLQVACGGAHTLALTSAREVYSWGNGRYGQLGHGELADCTSPQQLRVLHGIDIKLLLAGDCHSAALTNFGEVFTWGRGEYGQLGHGDESGRRTPFPIKDLQSAQNSVCYLSCGGDHMSAITYSGDVYTWGRNVFGQLGHGTFVDEFKPRKIEVFIGLVITAIYCGYHHTVALNDACAVFTWGRGELGALGHVYNKTIALPKKVDAIAQYRVVKAACGLNHTLVLTDEGKVISWGRGSYGQLGHGSGKPPALPPAEVDIPLWILPSEKRRQQSNKDSFLYKSMQLQRPSSCPPGFSFGSGDDFEDELSNGFNPHPGKLRPMDRVSRSASSTPMPTSSHENSIMRELMHRELQTGALQKELAKSRMSSGNFTQSNNGVSSPPPTTKK